MRNYIYTYNSMYFCYSVLHKYNMHRILGCIWMRLVKARHSRWMPGSQVPEVFCRLRPRLAQEKLSVGISVQQTDEVEKKQGAWTFWCRCMIDDDDEEEEDTFSVCIDDYWCVGLSLVDFQCAVLTLKNGIWTTDRTQRVLNFYELNRIDLLWFITTYTDTYRPL